MDPVVYSKIKTDYMAVVASYGHKLPDNFELAAFSQGGKTYILSEVVKDLTIQQQAINLIHEFLMRKVTKPMRAKLMGIWQVEVELLNVLADEIPVKKNFSLL